MHDIQRIVEGLKHINNHFTGYLVPHAKVIKLEETMVQFNKRGERFFVVLKKVDYVHASESELQNVRTMLLQFKGDMYAIYNFLQEMMAAYSAKLDSINNAHNQIS